MTYSVTKSDGQIIVVADGTINNSTSVTLVGRNYPSYGQIENDNFIRLLENSSDPTPPPSPITGELWWDSLNNVLKVYTGSIFKPISSATVASSAPVSAVIGDLWWNTGTSQLSVYNNSAWVVVGPATTSSTGQTGAFVGQVTDNQNVTHTVVDFYVANSLVAIMSTDQQFTPYPPISGFSVINPGFNLINTGIIPNVSYSGTVQNASNLNNISSSQFLRSDINASTTGQVTINNNNGIIIGLNNALQLGVTGVNGYLNNNTANGGFTLGVTNSAGTHVNGISMDCNGNVTFPGNITVGGSISSSLSNSLNLTGNINSTSTTTGTLTVLGGVGLTGNINVGGSVTGASSVISGTAAINNLNVSGQVVLSASTVSSNISTGAFVVGGGIGIGGNANIGGTLKAGNTAITGTLATSSNLTVSSGGITVASGGITSNGSLSFQGNSNAVSWPSGVSVYQDTSGNGPGDLVIHTVAGSNNYYSIFSNSGNLSVSSGLSLGNGTISDSAWVPRITMATGTSGGTTYQANSATTSWMHIFKNAAGTTTHVLGASPTDLSLYSAGNVTAYWSDQRLKEMIEKVNPSDGLTRVLAYNIVEFQWNEKGRKLNGKLEGVRERGLIAQEVQVINDQVTTENILGKDEDGNPYLTVQESKIVFDLICAIQAQQKQIDELKSLLGK